MKIKEIQIRQFGRFDDWTLTLPTQSFAAIHGPNEAGKSTVRQMILSILFNFPKKAVLDRYLRQKESHLTSGRLLLSLSSGEQFFAERSMHDKELIMTLEKGDSVPAELLLKNFGGIDRKLYEAVFCFDLDGLNGLDELGAADLNQWLFNASMAGAASIGKLEQSLQKKLDELFKPTGRKPLINSTVSELDKTRQSLVKWEKNIDHYDSLKTQLVRLKEKSVQLDDDYLKYEQKKEQFNRYHSLQPLMIDHNVTREEKAELETIRDFPEQGVERLDRWQTQRLTLYGQRAQIRQRLDSLAQRLNQLVYPRDQAILYERDVKDLMKMKPSYDQQLVTIKELNEKKGRIFEKYGLLLNKLGAEWSIEAIKEASVGIEASNKLSELTEELNKILQGMDHAEKELERRQQDVKEQDRRLREKNSQLLSDAKREEYKRVSAAMAGNSEKKAEHKTLIFQRDFLQKKVQSEQKWKRVSQVSGTLLFILTILALLFFKNTLPIDTLFIFIAPGMLVSLGLFSAPIFMLHHSKSRQELIKVNDQLKHLEREDPDHDRNNDRTELLLEKDERLRLEVDLAKRQLADHKKAYENALIDWDDRQFKKETLYETFNEWKKTYRFLANTDVRWLPEVYHQVEDIKDLLFEEHQVIDQMERIKKEKVLFDETLDKLCSDLHLDNSDYYELEQALKVYEDRKNEGRQRQEQQEEMTADENELTMQIRGVDHSVKELFERAKVSNEEDFRKRAEQVKREKIYSERLSDLQRQMKQIVPDDLFIKQSFQWLKDNKWAGVSHQSLKEEETQLKLEINELKKKRLEAESEIIAYEKDQSYNELRYAYETQKAELNESAKEWSLYQTSLMLLQQTKESYRREKLPTIIKHAGHYFSIMTNGAYQSMDVSEDGEFSVLSERGKTFYIKELSRGTHEQLYLSIRLALTQSIGTEEKLPIIIDDGLVNTDQARYNSIIRVLKEVGQKHQIIFLTCHPERLTDLPDEQKVQLSGSKEK